MGIGKKIFGGGLIAAVVYGAYRLFGMASASDKITTEFVKPRIHKVDLTGVTFRTGVSLANGSNETIRLSQPIVQLFTDGKMLAQSTPSSDETLVKPKATSLMAKEIELKLSWLTLAPYIKDIASAVVSIISTWKSGDNEKVKSFFTIPLEVVYSTEVVFVNKVMDESITYTSPPTKLI